MLDYTSLFCKESMPHPHQGFVDALITALALHGSVNLWNTTRKNEILNHQGNARLSLSRCRYVAANSHFDRKKCITYDNTHSLTPMFLCSRREHDYLSANLNSAIQHLPSCPLPPPRGRYTHRVTTIPTMIDLCRV